ncbi:MAG: hypothetical protein A2V74_00620 [Acidobacteria bacterium RBG_16_70_10]|nr:MAG: hypothetical protein A2V74_00620 [Acidobacteria bacterium RBG_16_70_10]
MSDEKTRVMVVDDEPGFSTLVATALSDRGFQAVAVNGPEPAIELARSGSVGVAVIDLVMPGMGGLELAAHLRGEHPEIEVVILTGHANLETAVEGIRQGVLEYIDKHALDLDRLERAVRAALTRAELRRENRRLLAQLRESNRLLRRLNESSAQLAAAGHPDQLLGTLVRSAKSLLGAESARAVLMERNALGDLTVRVAAGDEAEAVLGAHFGREDGITTLVADTGVAVRTPERQQHPAYSPRCDRLPAAWPPLLCVPLSRRGLLGALTVAGRSHPFSVEEEHMLVALARVGGIGIENTRNHEHSQNFFIHATEMLVTLIDAQDVHRTGHARAVAALSDMITRRLGLPEEDRRTVHYAALLHDIGMLGLGPHILASDRVLGADEGELMRRHPVLGAEILRPISLWEGLLPIVRSHHERWDGKGYPAGLKGEEIPLGARVVGLAEAFDTMTRPSPWRAARTFEAAKAEIEACTGTQFDPTIARLFLAELREHGHLLRRPSAEASSATTPAGSPC